MARMRGAHGSAPPAVFTPAQLHAITFGIWAHERNAEGDGFAARFARLFTVLLLCTKPADDEGNDGFHCAPAASGDVSAEASAQAKADAGRAEPHVVHVVLAHGMADTADAVAGAASTATGEPGTPSLSPPPSPPTAARVSFNADEPPAQPGRARAASAPGIPFLHSAARPSDPSELPPSEASSYRSDASMVGTPPDGSQARGSGALPPPPEAPPVHAPNPVLLALQLASRCAEEASRLTRDRLVTHRLEEGAVLFEHVACGLLHCAAQAAIESEARKQVNPWKMGKTLIHPEIARDLFVHDCVEHAAEHEHKIFIAYPLVFAHLHELFWPKARAERAAAQVGVAATRRSWQSVAADGAALAAAIVANAAVLPLLPFIPASWEIELEIYLRKKVHRSELPLGLIWLLPSGRFALWLASTGVLAVLVTTLSPNPAAAGAPELALVAYLLGWCYSELEQLADASRKYGTLPGVRKFFSDPFNVLDALIIVTLIGLLGARAVFFSATDGLNDDAGRLPPLGSPDCIGCATAASGHGLLPEFVLASATPMQALLALFSWLRLIQVRISRRPCRSSSCTSCTMPPPNPLLPPPPPRMTNDLPQVLFIIPSSGPLLLMAVRMLSDLSQFLTLACFVIVAFGCAFYVLLHAAHLRAQAEAAEANVATAAATTVEAASGVPSTSATDGAPAAEASFGALPPLWPITSAHQPHPLSIVAQLVQGTLNGESAHLLDAMQDGMYGLGDYSRHAADATFAWLLMALFGVAVVLLLLNLLIARFAKTFDILFENIDANFKVAFARVVIEANRKHLLPPPLNLLRALVLLTYELIGRRCYGDSLKGALRDAAIRALNACCLSEHAYAELHDDAKGGGRDGVGAADDDNLDSDEMPEVEVAHQVRCFLGKASDSQRQLYPEGVEQYVLTHQHDIAREEHWRTAMQKDIAAVSMQIKALLKADEAHQVRELPATPSYTLQCAFGMVRVVCAER